ncbi:CRTAC1 family protein [Edaphobacter sp.]|uniref:CRTAC1 family protein n=1 Tax=Edaphobacter sp. TaxID=1934404 RepID=UPI002DBDF2F2|nr:CRTAC1 family protein [Edaphobacter sp.]HEU5342287.1 CRTAC1 family protein [Edaphobacter sp.]
MYRPTHRLSRRTFLHAASAAALGAASKPSLAHALLAPEASAAQPAFVAVSAEKSGIHWTHTAGLSPQMYLPETVGPGCAFLDYDNDGWMDIYLVNSGPCDFYKPAHPLRNALYRNNRDGTFTDVTLKAGVPGNAYGMGVAVGDYDGDGLPDLYVTQYPNSILYHNNGDGTFTDVTAKAGVAAPGWGTSAVWFDYDNDGRLDLFVCRFADFDKAKNVTCGPPGARFYCKPNVYKPLASRLFHNNGDGTFTDVSAETGIAKTLGKAWGVVAADINNDGWLDLFVASDTAPNALFINSKGRFSDVGTLAGVAYSPFGVARSGMGVDAADYNQDGWLDLFVANVDHESYALYRNNHDETFDDVSIASGIGPVTTLMSGWGLKFFDYNNDGNLDLILSNGHPDTTIDSHQPGVHYFEPMLLFENNGSSWKNVSSESGPIFAQDIAGRGLALGDFNNDGAIDVLVAVNNGPPVLLRNTATEKNHWLGLRLIGRKANIDAIGAKVIYQAGTLKRTVTKVGGGSYLSSHDPRIVLGLGQQTKLDWIEIHWPQPSGKVERFTSLPVDRYITIVEGQGRWTQV